MFKRKPKRRRLPAFCNFIARHGCVICRRPAVVHHLIHIKVDKIGRRDDRYIIGLCPEHHQGLHHDGQETRYLAHYGIDGKKLNEKLWAAFQENPDN